MIERDLTGSLVGNYRLIRKLGRGGFAEVYLGQHQTLTTHQVAIKIVYVPIDQALFQKEAEMVASLAHSHIVRLFDFAQYQGMPYLVMDYAPNGSLRDRHPKGSQLPLETVVAYSGEIATALQYAHDQHIIHRDVKPENVLIGRHGELLLSDFGIATLSATGRTSHHSYFGKAGTPLYRPAEQFRGKPEKASDQYALAIMAYEWLCGTPPFTEGDELAIAFQHLSEPVPSLCARVPALDKRVESVILRALAKDHKDRYESVQAFAAALKAAATHPKPAPATPQPPPSPAVSPPGKTKEQWLEEGNTHHNAKRFEEAVIDYSRAIELDPKYAVAYYNRGNAYHNKQQYEQAIADYSRAIELDPTYALAYINRGYAYYNKQQYEQAMRDYTRALELDPNNTWVRDNKARLEKKMGKR